MTPSKEAIEAGSRYQMRGKTCWDTSGERWRSMSKANLCALANQVKASAPRMAAARELAEAAQRVLDGLEARLDRASHRAEPLPVFNGIADLTAALARWNKAGGSA